MVALANDRGGLANDCVPEALAYEPEALSCGGLAIHKCGKAINMFGVAIHKCGIAINKFSKANDLVSLANDNYRKTIDQDDR